MGSGGVIGSECVLWGCLGEEFGNSGVTATAVMGYGYFRFKKEVD